MPVKDTRRKEPPIPATGLPLAQAAKKAGVSSQRIHVLYQQGRIRAIKTPLGLLYREADVNKYVAERRARDAKRANKQRGAA